MRGGRDLVAAPAHAEEGSSLEAACPSEEEDEEDEDEDEEEDE